jgi:HK97 family phage portal protein
MPLIFSSGAVRALPTVTSSTPVQVSHLYREYLGDYASLYRTQPNVRVCVDFLSRNIAQLGLHVFRRLEDDNRERLRDHPLTLALARPNGRVTSKYRLIEALIADIAIYWNAYWWLDDSPRAFRIIRMPPGEVTVYGGLFPEYYVWDSLAEQRRRTISASNVVHFRGYHPTDGKIGLSPLETLRRRLAEESAADDYRESFWRQGARIGGYIKRPKSAGDWSDAARARFREQFTANFTGARNAGKIPILEDDMSFEPATRSAVESQYLEARKLTREECAAAWFIPPPMIGILEHATYSNIKEQHKQMYMDCLAPYCVSVEDDVELQLLPMFADVENVYVEFNISEKLKGSFEEQSKSLTTAVGAPWMSRNEARARMNLTRVEDETFDRPVTPLNTSAGAISEDVAEDVLEDEEGAERERATS